MSSTGMPTKVTGSVDGTPYSRFSVFDEPREEERTTQPDRHTDGGKHQPFLDVHPDDIRPLCPERDADPRFMGALSRQVRDDAVDAHG
jgi:hypothetical protein